MILLVLLIVLHTHFHTHTHTHTHTHMCMTGFVVANDIWSCLLCSRNDACRGSKVMCLKIESIVYCVLTNNYLYVHVCEYNQKPVPGSNGILAFCMYVFNVHILFFISFNAFEIWLAIFNYRGWVFREVPSVIIVWLN